MVDSSQSTTLSQGSSSGIKPETNTNTTFTLFSLISISLYTISILFYLISILFYLINILFYLISILVYLISILFYLISILFYLNSTLFNLISILFYLISIFCLINILDCLINMSHLASDVPGSALPCDVCQCTMSSCSASGRSNHCFLTIGTYRNCQKASPHPCMTTTASWGVKCSKWLQKGLYWRV